MITHHIPLVLASGSAIRAQMLKSAGLKFSVAPSNVDENAIKTAHAEDHSDPYRLATGLARAKAQNVAPAYPEHITIAADQICECEGHIFDKPETRERAQAQLAALAGKTHRQISGCCLARGGEILWEFQASALLTMRVLSEEEIARYIEADMPLKSCGAYHYEALGKHLFTRIEGSEDVIKGLPLQPLIAQLHEMGAIAL